MMCKKIIILMLIMTLTMIKIFQKFNNNNKYNNRMIN